MLFLFISKNKYDFLNNHHKESVKLTFINIVWKNSSSIINHLTNNIPTMSHYSWTKELRTLDKKLNGNKNK